MGIKTQGDRYSRNAPLRLPSAVAFSSRQATVIATSAFGLFPRGPFPSAPELCFPRPLRALFLSVPAFTRPRHCSASTLRF